LQIETEDFDQLPEEVKCDVGGFYSVFKKRSGKNKLALSPNYSTRDIFFDWLTKKTNFDWSKTWK
jgi:hypothetical protein